jgi:hypothetical protein
LKQLKLISEKSSWPIVTEKQADSLTNIANAHLNPFGKTVLSAGLSQANSNEQYPRRNIHTSSRVNQPGGTGGKSSIVFSNEIDDTTASRTRFHSNKNASQFSIGDDDTVSEAGSITGSSRRRGKSQFESGIEFGDDGPESQTQTQNQTRSYTKPSSRVLKPPGGGGSQITFG